MTKAQERKRKVRARKRCVFLCKQYVRGQAKNRCERCGKGEPDFQTHGAHVFPEQVRELCDDPDNVVCLCASCHKWAKDSWHNSPLEAAEWFNSKFPGRYQALKDRLRTAKYEDTMDYWETRLRGLKVLVSLTR